MVEEATTIAKYVERFRNSAPCPREARLGAVAAHEREFWWVKGEDVEGTGDFDLHDESTPYHDECSKVVDDFEAEEASEDQQLQQGNWAASLEVLGLPAIDQAEAEAAVEYGEIDDSAHEASIDYDEMDRKAGALLARCAAVLSCSGDDEVVQQQHQHQQQQQQPQPRALETGLHLHSSKEVGFISLISDQGQQRKRGILGLDSSKATIETAEVAVEKLHSTLRASRLLEEQELMPPAIREVQELESPNKDPSISLAKSPLSQSKEATVGPPEWVEVTAGPLGEEQLELLKSHHFDDDPVVQVLRQRMAELEDVILMRRAGTSGS